MATAFAGFSNRSSAAADAFFSIFGVGGSRAGAGALAAPLATGAVGALNTGRLNSTVGAGAAAFGGAGVATAALYNAGGATAAAGATAFSATGAAGVSFVAAGVGWAATDAAAGHAADMGGAVGFGTVVAGGCGLGGTAVAAGTTSLGAAGATGFVPPNGGLGAIGFGGAGAGVGESASTGGGVGTAKLPVAVADPGFVGSLLRSNPRATRRVPFACSMLMGLVRTRFAPMRNALATPA